MRTLILEGALLLGRSKSNFGPIKPIADGLVPASFNWLKDKLPYQFAFLGRMLFSCLVDADFRDTERFSKASG